MRLAFALLCSAIVLTGAGQPGEVRIRSGPYNRTAATIAVETNLVELAAIVRDHKGEPVAGLQKTDFLVFDNLKRQEIVSLQEQRSRTQANGSARSRYIALFFDDTHSGMAGLARTKHAAEKLIGEGLKPGDRVGLFTGSGAVTLAFTSDSKTLLATLANIRRHPSQYTDRGFGVCPTLSAYQAYVITNHLDLGALDVAAADIEGCSPATPWDVALQEAQTAGETAWSALRFESSDVLNMLAVVVRTLATAPGDRMLLMVSPGFITSGMEQKLDTLTATLVHAHITVNALDDEGLLSGGLESPESLGARSGPRTGWAERTLGERTQTITSFLAGAAASTGGRFIYNNNALADALRTLAEAPEVSYLIGFSPADRPNGKYHKLKVILAKAGGFEVSARPGYFSSVQAAQTETAQRRIDRAVASNDLLDQFPATVKVRADPGNGGRYLIQVTMMLDAKRLPFAAQGDKSVQQLTFVTVLEDSTGNPLEGKQAVMDLSLTSATRSELEAKGIKASTSFLAAKGSYRIREVIREAIHNRLVAANCDLEVPSKIQTGN